MTESKVPHPGNMQGYQPVSGQYIGPVTYPSYTRTSESFDQLSARGINNDNDCNHTWEKTEWNPVRPARMTISSYSEAQWPQSYDEVTLPVPAYYWLAKFPTKTSAPFGSDGLYGLGQLSYPGTSVTNPLIERSLAAMLPGIREGLMSVNSILELKDFKTLPVFLKRIKLFSGNLPKWVRTSKKATLRELVKEGSEGYLTYQFALRPLVSDIIGLYKSLTSYHQQVENLLRNEGKPQRARFSCSVDNYVPAASDQTVQYARTYVRGFIDCRRIVSYPKGAPKFRATVEYTYTLSEAQKANAELYGLLDSLGVNPNPQIIWNAIPWSFALDWVAGVSRWLGQFQHRLLEPRVNIHRYVWSYTCRQRIECRMHFSPGRPYSSENLVGSIDRDLYMRRAHQPDWVRGVTTSGLNLKEFSFITALIGTRY